MKEVVIRILKRALKEKGIELKDEEIDRLIEIPSNSDIGDYAFPCFFLSDVLKQEPEQAAIELREKIGTPNVMEFEDAQTSGPYINFFINRKSLARKVVWEAITQKKNYGKLNMGGKKKIVIEFSSPNTAKPFGIGHLRSTIIGNSLANIFEFEGFKVIRINYLGDWGTQFGKLITGYDKFGSEKKLQKDPIKHLMQIYVKANKKIYDKKAREEFRKLENRERKQMMLWRLFRGYSLKEFKKIYKLLGIKFDLYEAESDYNRRAKKLIGFLKEKKLLKKSKGALVIDLEKDNLGTVLIEKSDGTTLYSTRDILAAVSRYKKYKFENMLYEVGQEQKLYFNQLFRILELMGYEWARRCIHVDHGLYLDKTGKRFATRKGKTVFMEDILNETKELAKKEIKKRTKKISKKELEKRALSVAIAAIFYGDLKNNRSKNIAFDLKKFVSFEGNTGPYLLYSYARATSILKKTKNQDKFKVYDLESQEYDLIKKLSHFQEIVSRAQRNLNPSVIANYSYQVAQLFNEFYQSCRVIGSEQEAFRLALVEAFRQVLKNALGLLGIKTLEEM
jgi:arginyl-tRNA synthetase